jgi:hypothetical protein
MLEQFLTAQKTHKKLIKYLLENMKRNPPSNYQLQIETLFDTASPNGITDNIFNRLI